MSESIEGHFREINERLNSRGKDRGRLGRSKGHRGIENSRVSSLGVQGTVIAGTEMGET